MFTSVKPQVDSYENYLYHIVVIHTIVYISLYKYITLLLVSLELQIAGINNHPFTVQ